jgi:hypothetical protein
MMKSLRLLVAGITLVCFSSTSVPMKREEIQERLISYMRRLNSGIVHNKVIWMGAWACALIGLAGSAQAVAPEHADDYGTCGASDDVDALITMLRRIAEEFGFDVLHMFVGDAIRSCMPSDYPLLEPSDKVKSMVDFMGYSKDETWHRQLCNKVGVELPMIMRLVKEVVKDAGLMPKAHIHIDY